MVVNLRILAQIARLTPKAVPIDIAQHLNRPAKPAPSDVPHQCSLRHRGQTVRGTVEDQRSSAIPVKLRFRNGQVRKPVVIKVATRRKAPNQFAARFLWDVGLAGW